MPYRILVVSAARKVIMGINQRQWASGVGSALGLPKPHKANGSAQHSTQHGQPKICPDCGGTGDWEDDGNGNTRNCVTCKGTGKLQA